MIAKDKICFQMTLFDDDAVREKLTVMSKMDVMFDDSRNNDPDEYYELINNLPLGSSIRITVEVVKEQPK